MSATQTERSGVRVSRTVSRTIEKTLDKEVCPGVQLNILYFLTGFLRKKGKETHR